MIEKIEYLFVKLVSASMDWSEVSIPENDADAFYTKALNFVAAALAITAIISIIYAGFLYTRADGDVGKLRTAKLALIGSIIGFALSLSAFSIANFVLGGLGG